MLLAGCATGARDPRPVLKLVLAGHAAALLLLAAPALGGQHSPGDGEQPLASSGS